MPVVSCSSGVPHSVAMSWASASRSVRQKPARRDLDLNDVLVLARLATGAPEPGEQGTRDSSAFMPAVLSDRRDRPWSRFGMRGVSSFVTYAFPCVFTVKMIQAQTRERCESTHPGRRSHPCPQTLHSFPPLSARRAGIPMSQNSTATCERRRRRLWAPAPCPRRERLQDAGRRIAARGGLAPEDLDRAPEVGGSSPAGRAWPSRRASQATSLSQSATAIDLRPKTAWRNQ